MFRPQNPPYNPPPFKRIEAYIASDGKCCASEAEAYAHERSLIVSKHIAERYDENNTRNVSDYERRYINLNLLTSEFEKIFLKVRDAKLIK